MIDPDDLDDSNDPDDLYDSNDPDDTDDPDDPEDSNDPDDPDDPGFLLSECTSGVSPVIFSIVKENTRGKKLLIAHP